MRLMVIGAGASYAECKAAGLSDARSMPLMKDLARKLWADYNPTPFLEAFLLQLGKSISSNPMEQFFELELSREGLIEEFFSFSWNHRNEFHTPYGRCWDDLLCHGLMRPLNFIILTELLKNGEEPTFPLSEAVANALASDDVVLNLNYDLIFDVALKNVGKEAVYSPHAKIKDRIWCFKPHGSFHMAVDESQHSFCFGKVEFIGDIQPSGGGRTYASFIPPRHNKSFSQHHHSRMIAEPLLTLKPDIVSFWGIGNPASDVDLYDVYRLLCSEADRIEYINPSERDATRFGSNIGRSVVRYNSAQDWIAAMAPTI